MIKKVLITANTKHIKNDVYFVPEKTIEIADNAFALADKGTVKRTAEGVLFVEGGDDPIFSIKKIVLPKGIKKIGANAFYDTLLSVTDINIPSSLEEIGDFAFWGMDKLKKVSLTPKIETIGKDAFCNCPKLTIHFKGRKSDIPKGWHKDWHGNCKVKYETKIAAVKAKQKELKQKESNSKVKPETKKSTKSKQKEPNIKISRIKRQKLWRANSDRLKRNKKPEGVLDFSNALPLLKDGFEGEPCYFSLAENGPHLDSYRNLKRSNELNEYITQYIAEEGATWALSDCREERKTLYNIPQPLVHVGVDIIAPAGTPLYSPFDAKMVMLDYDDRNLGYGWYCLLETVQDGNKFYLLFGHLSGKNLAELGTKIKAGEQFAQIGSFFENGRWFHHTHFQVLTQKAYDKQIVGAFIDKSDLDIVDNFFPSPLSIIYEGRRKTKIRRSAKEYKGSRPKAERYHRNKII